MDKTTKNLEEALAGEAHAYFRYLGFAEKAEEEGHPGAARLFRAVARAERVHALSHQKVLDTAKGTIENIESAIQGETHEFKKMYPPMIQDAVAEKQIEARHSFEYAMSIEMIHAKLFKKALKDPDANPESTYYICPLCGHTVMDKAPNKCPYCGVDAKQFIEVT
jgi:rubrerythrin